MLEILPAAGSTGCGRKAGQTLEILLNITAPSLRDSRLAGQRREGQLRAHLAPLGGRGALRSSLVLRPYPSKSGAPRRLVLLRAPGHRAEGNRRRD